MKVYLHLEHYMQFWSPQLEKKKNTEKLEQGNNSDQTHKTASAGKTIMQNNKRL